MSSTVTSIGQCGYCTVAAWDVARVMEWLKANGVAAALCDVFASFNVTGRDLLRLDDTILEHDLGIISQLQRMRLCDLIHELRIEQQQSSGAAHCKVQGHAPSIPTTDDVPVCPDHNFE